MPRKSASTSLLIYTSIFVCYSVVNLTPPSSLTQSTGSDTYTFHGSSPAISA
ncbi:hypothetical protein KEM48_009303, partial [Puccinia striiformis f. sp. tritici PST-130]